jgi:hypothetical protein
MKTYNQEKQELMVKKEIRNNQINHLVDRYHNNPESFSINRIIHKNTQRQKGDGVIQLLSVLFLASLSFWMFQSLLFFIQVSK